MALHCKKTLLLTFFFLQFCMLNISPHPSFTKMVLFHSSKCKFWLICTTIFLYITFTFLQKGKKYHRAHFNSQITMLTFISRKQLLPASATCIQYRKRRYSVSVGSIKSSNSQNAFSTSKYHNNRQLMSRFPQYCLLWLPIRTTSANILI